jgi:glycosyltransferase involved in cell wall biosynthesis
MKAEPKLLVEVILQDQRRVPIATIHARRRWREAAHSTDHAVVSVIIPCYNQAHFVAEAIESVLTQTHRQIEVVVVDDGSTDNTAAVVGRYPEVRYFQQENLGLAAARNTGLRFTGGDYLVFLDADDRLLPEALATGLSCLRAHPECAFASGHCTLIASDGSLLSQPDQQQVESQHYLALLRRCYIWPPATVMYRRSVFDSVHGFDQAVAPAADYELYLRIARDFPVCSHASVVAEYRQHGANMTRDPALMLIAALKVLRSQRPHVKRRSKEYQEAFENGIQYERGNYGERLVADVLARVGDGDWRQVLRGLRVLLQYYPQGFASIVTPDSAVLAEHGRSQTRIQQLTQEKEAARREVVELRRIIEAHADDLNALARETDDVSLQGIQTELDRVGYHLQDQLLLRELPEIVESAVPGTATVLVASNGNDALVQLNRLSGWDLPATAASAITHVQALQARGEEFLVLPGTASWWLDDYAALKQYLDSHYPTVWNEKRCVIYQLSESQAGSGGA